jgi:hypothetical protein
VLRRWSYLAVSNVFALVRLLPVCRDDKDVEILALRHQLAVLRRQVDRPRLTGTDRALLAVLLGRLPRARLRQMLLIVSPDTILRWHRNLLRRRHAAISGCRRPGRPPTRRSVQALVLRLARENTSRGYRRIHGELTVLGVAVAPSTVWEIRHRHGIEPAPLRDRTTWFTFLRGQAQAIIACDFFTATTLTGTTVNVLAVIEHATRRVRILGASVHPTGEWATQLARNLLMDLQDAGTAVKYLIRDRGTRFTEAFNSVFTGEGIPHRTLISAAPLTPRPQPITDSGRLDHLDVRRRDRLGGILHEYTHAA